MPRPWMMSIFELSMVSIFDTAGDTYMLMDAICVMDCWFVGKKKERVQQQIMREVLDTA